MGKITKPRKAEGSILNTKRRKQEREKLNMTFKEEIEKMGVEELRYWLKMYHERFISFEKFLERELGRETFMDLVKEHALEDSVKWAKGIGIPERIVGDFEQKMKHEEEQKN